MGLSPRAGLFGGVAVLSAAVVLLQIVLTRMFSALFGHQLAFLSVSLALFGAGTGGAMLYAAPALARPPALLARLSALACLMSASTIAMLLFLVRQKPFTTLDSAELGRLVLLYLVCALPFMCAGIAIAGAIRHAARDVSKLYLTDLAAAAAGGASALIVLHLGAPRALLAIALLAAFAGLWLALPTYRSPTHMASRSPSGAAPFGFVATMILGTSVLLAGDMGSPWLKLGDMRDVRVDRAELQKWSALAFVTVDKPSGGMAWIHTDASAASAILDSKTTAPLHPDEMGYVLQKDQGPVLVIGAGGGRDVRAALKYGQKDIDAAEINAVIVNDLMRGKYKEFSGDLYGRAEVHAVVADGRSFVRASSKKYRAIVLSLVDTRAASPVDGLAFPESSLYTVEAFRDFLEHLTPEGTLTVNRWDNEIPRLLALASAGLRAAGAASPKAHIFACSHDRTTAVLVKREPLSRDETVALRKHCNKNKFREVFAPDVMRDSLAEQLVASRAGFIDSSGDLDLRAPTDDRPFFFHTLPAQAVLKRLGSPKELAAQHQGMALMQGLFAVSAGLVALFLLLPLALGALRARTPARARRAPRTRPLAFFLFLGGGFIFVEMGVVQQLTLFLGHPVYALSTALAALLLSAGAGSLSTARVAASAAPAMAARRAQGLVGLLAIYAMALGPVLGRAMVLPFWVRVVFTVAVLVPPGVLMGSLVPLGVKVVAQRAVRILPWCWGLSGLASVMGTTLGTFAAMSFGFSATLLLAGAMYLLAALTVPRAAGDVRDEVPASGPVSA